MIKTNLMQKSEKLQVQTEIEILSEIDHANVVRLIEFYSEEKTYCLVSEMCYGGQLFDILCDKNCFGE